MKIRAVAAVAIATSMLLSACATSGPKFSEMASSMSAATQGMGRIYFYRTTVLGAAVQPAVRLNGEVVGKAVPNGFFYADRPAGNYQVATETEVERKLTFTLDAGQVRYVRLNISMGFFVGHVYGELVDEAKGQAEIIDMRYTGAPARNRERLGECRARAGRSRIAGSKGSSRRVLRRSCSTIDPRRVRAVSRGMRSAACAVGLAVIGVLALTGCGKYYWNRPGASQDEFARDSSKCARENALYQSGTRTYGIVLEDRYKACLKSRGWVRAQHLEPPPGWFRGIEGGETVKFDVPAPKR
jgi:hypothetical protein